MTPQAALIELLARVGARNGAAVLVSAEELSQWPAAAVAAMKSQKLLAKTRPAVSVVCPGCERECVMPVHTVPAGPRGPVSFTVCDKRSDINRVPVPPSDCRKGGAMPGPCADLSQRASDCAAAISVLPMPGC